MGITRDVFSEHFYPAVLVNGIQRWQLRLIAPPEWLPRALYDAISGSNGLLSVPRDRFRAAVWELIVETHERDRKAKLRRPDAHEFTNKLYDALSPAGSEVSIG